MTIPTTIMGASSRFLHPNTLFHRLPVLTLVCELCRYNTLWNTAYTTINAVLFANYEPALFNGVHQEVIARLVSFS